MSEMTITADDWGWRHGGRQAWALRNLNFQISPGERVLLLGASGIGKSTLLHGLAGLLSPEEGESWGNLTFNGEPFDSRVRGGIGLVQQDPDSQIVMESIGDEVAFGLENLGVPAEEIWRRVEDSLATVGLDYALDHPTNRLSGGEKQRLALACTLAMQPQVLLLDEPTANLDPEGVAEVRKTVGEVVERTGCTLVVIEHRVEIWLDLATRALVLGAEGILADGPAGSVLWEQRDELLQAGIWLPDAVAVPAHSTCAQLCPGTVSPLKGLCHAGVTQAEPSTSVACLTTTQLSVGYDSPVLESLNLEFGSGKSTCITGPNGAGKTTLALVLAGLMEPLSGTCHPSAIGLRSRDLPAQISMVFQEPSYQFLCSTVREELKLSASSTSSTSPTPSSAGGHIWSQNGSDNDHNRPPTEGDIDMYLERLGLIHLQNAHPQTLSGGEKRRLSVAIGLISRPKVLILDEPTFGQDYNTWHALVQIIQEVVQQGTSVIAITHDQNFIKAIGQDVLNLAGSPENLPEPIITEPPRIAPLSQANPLALIFGLVLMTMPLILTIDIVSATVALGLELITITALGWTPRRIFRRIWPLLVAAPLAAISMLLYATPQGQVFFSGGPINITENSIQLAVAIALRIVAVGLPAIIILSSLAPTAVADSLTQVAKFPPKPVLASLAGIRLVALMIADWQALQRARRSRGVGDQNRFAAFASNSFSLLTFALRRAGTLSITMEARGFGAPIKRSYARQSSIGKTDGIVLLICLMIPTLSLAAAVGTDTFRWFGI